MAEFVAGKGTTAMSIIALILGSLGVVGNGGVGGLLNQGDRAGCNDGHVSRNELAQEGTISRLESENALLRANIYGDQKLLEVYKYVDGELKDIRAVQSAQAVTNAKIEGTFAVLGEQIHAQRNEFMCALNRERDERCCGDNSIVNYTNATFYPKMVADVTTGTTTTAQAIYNPLPTCGCCK
jgi:hypothetical protein